MTEPSDVIQVLIADDQTLFRAGMRALLHSIPETSVVGEAADGRASVQMARDLMPDVILMDLKMPVLNGIEATRQIIQSTPHIGIIVLTMYEDDASVFAAMRAGARGYILKGADQSDVLRAIRAVANGEAIFAPSVAHRLMAYFQSSRRLSLQDELPELTAREIEVLQCISQGLSNRAIAEALVISPKTVRNHISNIFSKLQITDRMEAIMIAKRAGLS